MNRETIKQALMILIATVLITGCTTSSGVVSMGQNTYMISRNQWGFRGSSPVIAAALKEAGDYCKKHGKEMKVIKTVQTGLKFGTEPAAEVFFKCLDPNDPELKTNTVIEEIRD